MISNGVLYEYAEMNSLLYDDYCSSPFSSESPFFHDFRESARFIPEFQTIDTFANSNLYDDVWLNNDKSASIILTPPRKKRKISETISVDCYPTVEQLVTRRNNYFEFNDEYLLEVDKELPDVILASPRKKNARRSIVPAESHFRTKPVTYIDSSLPLYDDNPNTSFEDVLRKVQREMDLRGDAVTYEDIEFLEDLLAGKIDYHPNYTSSQSVVTEQTDEEIICEDLTSYNEISCNLNSQQSAVSDSQSAIRKLLKNDAFKGNFEKKKSTEILSEMELSKDHLIYEHNYCATGGQVETKVVTENHLETCSSIDLNPKTSEIAPSKSKTQSTENASRPRDKKSKKETKSTSSSKRKQKSSTKSRSKVKAVVTKEPVTKPDDLEKSTKNPAPPSVDHTNTGDSSTANSPPVLEFSSQNNDCLTPCETTPDQSCKTESSELSAGNSALELSTGSNNQPNDQAIPKKEKKKLSVEEYLKKRAKRDANDTTSKSDQPGNDENTVPVPKIDSNESTIKAEDGGPKVPAKSAEIPAISLVEFHRRNGILPAVMPPSSATNTNQGKEKAHVGLKNENKPKKPVVETKPKPESKAIVEKNINFKKENKCSSVCSSTFSPNENSQSLDNCDVYSSSGISSYHNSSVSSLCGSPFTTLDEKSNDTKYGENDSTSTTAKNPTSVIKQSPFALNMDLLRKKSHHTTRRKHGKSKQHSKYSKAYDKRKSHRKSSFDSCFEDDSDSSYDSGKERSRKRQRTTSSSSTDESFNRSHAERSLSPRTYNQFADWNRANSGAIYEPSMLYNQPPNMYYPPPPPTWHPEYNFCPPYPANIEPAYCYDNRFCSYNTKGVIGSEAPKRILYVGNIENGLSKEDFRKRFEKFGTVQEAKLHFRENGTNYGFIYYSSTEEAYKAMKHGNDDPYLPQYSYGFGNRKERTDGRNSKYGKNYSMPEFIPVPVPVPVPVPHNAPEVDSYDLKLRQFKNDLQQKLTAQPYKYK